MRNDESIFKNLFFPHKIIVKITESGENDYVTDFHNCGLVITRLLSMRKI